MTCLSETLIWQATPYSSNLHSFAYDSDWMQLWVRFRRPEPDGGLRVYRYHAVPEHIYNRLATSTSPGGYFCKNVAKVFIYERIR